MTRTDTVQNSLDHSRTAGMPRVHPAKLSSTSHPRGPDDAQSHPGPSVLLGTADIPPPKLSSGSAFRPLSHTATNPLSHTATNPVRRSSSLSRATMIKSPPLSRSRTATVTGAVAAAAATSEATAVTSNGRCSNKTLPPPTPHVSAAAGNRNVPVGFEDNFVSPMVFKSHGGRVGQGAFSRPPAEQGCSSLTLSPPSQRRVPDTSRASDLQCPSALTTSSPPHNAQSEGNKSASSSSPVMRPSLPSPAPGALEVPSPPGGSPSKDRSLPSLDLNSTFTIASSSRCDTSRGFRPLSSLASTLTTGTPHFTGQLGDQRASLSSAAVHPESAPHQGNATGKLNNTMVAVCMAIMHF